MIETIDSYGDAFARAGDHTLHRNVQAIREAAVALKQRIAAVLPKLPADGYPEPAAAALAALDARL